jgi:hypothetical protein
VRGATEEEDVAVSAAGDDDDEESGRRPSAKEQVKEKAKSKKKGSELHGGGGERNGDASSDSAKSGVSGERKKKRKREKGREQKMKEKGAKKGKDEWEVLPNRLASEDSAQASQVADSGEGSASGHRGIGGGNDGFQEPLTSRGDLEGEFDGLEVGFGTGLIVGIVGSWLVWRIAALLRRRQGLW